MYCQYDLAVYSVSICGATEFGFASNFLSKFCQPLKTKF